MRTWLLCFLLGLTVCLYGQAYDNNWVHRNPIAGYTFNNGLSTYYDTSDDHLTFWRASSSISDYEGNLLFFSDGVHVLDKNGVFLRNTDSLAYGHIDSVYYFPGVPYVQGCLLLPMPDSDSLFYYFHTATFGQQPIQANRLFYSVIDRTLNSGKGEFVAWNSLLLDSVMVDAGMGLCKHANNEEWWLIKPLHNKNTYARFLVKRNGVIDGPFFQSIGLSSHDADHKGQVVFSVKGDKMGFTNGLQKGQLFDFDRCTGLLSNPRDYWNFSNGYYFGGIGLSFSPNGRFMYATGDSFQIDQYDTYAADLNSSKLTVAQTSSVLQLRQPSYHQLGPDGKIYIAGDGSPIPLTVINNPDSFGLACNIDTFSFYPFHYPSFTFGMPCFPHYRTPPSAAYAADAGRDTTVCDSLLQLSVGIPLGAPAVDSVMYAWSSPNDANFGGSTQGQIIVQPTSNAMYVLHIQDTSLAPKYSCKERWDTVHVTVTSNCFTSTPQSPKGDLNSQIQVSPNPARDYFFVETDMRDALLSVTDVEGRLVQKAEIRNQKTEIRCSGWARGVYFVTVRNKEGEKRVKVVVE